MLRMPVALRERLLAAASRSERSLNSEIVSRLEESLEADELVPEERTQRCARPSSRGNVMTRRRRHGIAGIAVVVLLAAAAVAGVTISGSPVAQTGPVAGDELPTALAGHLDKLRQAVPGNQGMAEEGSASGA